MKDFFRMMFIEPFQDDHWTGYLLGGLIWLWALIVAGLITCGVGNGINRIGREEQNGKSIVIEKCFVPAHSESYGKGQIRWVDDACHLHLEKDKLSDCVWVSHHYYNHTQIGDTICIRYYTGRLWNSLYIVSFCGEENNY